MIRTTLVVVLAVATICQAQPLRRITRPVPPPVVVLRPAEFVPMPSNSEFRAVMPRPEVAAKKDVVVYWCEVTLNAIKAEKTPPPIAARNLAVVHIAIYDAANAVDRKYEPFRFDERVPPGASVEAAVSAAAYRTLVNIYPRQIPAFNDALRAVLTPLPRSPRTSAGIAVGETIAKKVLEWREKDGDLVRTNYTTRDALGHWKPTPPDYRPPLLPEWTKVRPFALRNMESLHPPPPPKLDSDEFVAAFREVKELGGKTSRKRTEEQAQIATFWADGEGTVTPPGHWNRIATTISKALRLSTLENARLFAMLNVAMADAAIACWDCKFKFDFWRPVTAIRDAAKLNRSELDSDPNWEPLLTTPPFPAYTSGHSTFSGAAAAVLAAFLGSDQFRFYSDSEALPGVLRKYSSFSAAAEEAGMSRIYGGIHWSFDNKEGLKGGKKIGEYVSQNYFKPLE